MALWLSIILFIPLDGNDPSKNWQPARPTPAPVAKVEPVASTDADRLNDWLLETQARAALWQDERLGALDLEVMVKSSAATLFGPAPSEELRQKAVQVVRAVPGLREVRDHIRVRAPVELGPARPRMFPPVDHPFFAGSSDQADGNAGNARVLTGRPGGTPASGQPLRRHPQDETRPPHSGSAGEESPLEVALRRLIASNPRFREVSFHIDGNHVSLRGKVARMDELIDLVNAVSQMDGVERVQTEEVTVGR